MTDTLQKRSDAALADASDDQIIEAVAEADVISWVRLQPDWIP